MSDRINEVCLKATGKLYDKLSPALRVEFTRYYIHTDFANMSEEEYQRNFSMLAEEFDDWLLKQHYLFL